MKYCFLVYLTLLFFLSYFEPVCSAKNFKKSILKIPSIQKTNAIHKIKSNWKKTKQMPSIFKRLKYNQMDNFRFKESGAMEIPKGNVGMKDEENSEIGPVLKKGWLRFLKMPLIKTRNKGVKTFFINDVFFNQNGANSSSCPNRDSDEWGPFKIPNQYSFFFVLAKNSLYIVSARRNDLAKTIYVIPLSSLVKQEEGVYMGGVEDMGNFREGFCFKLNQMSPNGNIVFIICAESLDEKEDWMKAISKMKLKIQYVMGDAQLEGEALLGPSSYNKEDEPGCDEYGMAKGKRDGKWVVLQSWSTCTVTCGGGTQTLQRMCIPPSNGGKDCVGDKIITRPCNTQPCREVINVEAKTETANAKVRVMRVSDRPWIYERCVIKETDVDVVREDMTQFQVKPRVPGRAVLNNKTFTVFQTTSYDSVIFSAPLPAITVTDFKEDPSYCFTVLDSSNMNEERRVSLCGLKSSKQDLQELKNKWIEDIDFFKSNCYKPIRRKTENSMNRMRKEEIDVEELDDNANAMQQENYGAKAQQASEGMEGALAKEMKYERSMEDEELRREKLEDQKLQEHLEKMRMKEDCLKRTFKRNALKASGQAQLNDIDKQMKDLKDQIKNIIVKNRAEKSKKILFMRKMAERNRKKNFGEMEALRMKMTADVMKAQKKGNMSLCVDASIIQKYCNENFLDDPTLVMDCKDTKNYCYICCENEFGMMWPSERGKCLDQCESNGGNGNWVWVPAGNQISGSNSGGASGPSRPGGK